MSLASVLEEAIASQAARTSLSEASKKPTAYALGPKGGDLLFYDMDTHKKLKNFSGYFVNLNRITKGKPTMMLAKRKGKQLELTVIGPWQRNVESIQAVVTAEEKRIPGGRWTAERVRDYLLTMKTGDTVDFKTKPVFKVKVIGDHAGMPIVQWSGGGKKGKGLSWDLVSVMRSAKALKESVENIESVDLSGCDELFVEAVSEWDEPDNLEEGAGQDHILKQLQVGLKSEGGWIALNDVARGFKGHFKKLQKAAEVLVKQGKIETKQDSREGLMLRLKK